MSILSCRRHSRKPNSLVSDEKYCNVKPQQYGLKGRQTRKSNLVQQCCHVYEAMKTFLLRNAPIGALQYARGDACSPQPPPDTSQIHVELTSA